VSVQWIACPDCAFKLPYAILGKQGSFRTGREFTTLCRHRPEASGNGSSSGADGLWRCHTTRSDAKIFTEVGEPERLGSGCHAPGLRWASSTGPARNRSMAYVPSARMFRAALDRLVRSLGSSWGSVALR